MPAAARYSPAGEPSPPAPISKTLALRQFLLTLAADLIENNVPAITLYLLIGEFHVPEESSTVNGHSSIVDMDST